MRDGTQMPSPPWRRHELLHVAPDVWASALAQRPALADLPLLEHWAEREWPVIVRRRAQEEDSGLVPVGVALPPAAGKCRVALVLPPGGILQRSPPPLLGAAAKVADAGRQSTTASLLALGARTGVEPSAFGSLLWEYLTGLAYLSPQSDLDVLWPIPENFDILSLVFGIGQVQRDAPIRIDGEVIFPDGSAVNWRELWNAYRPANRSGHWAEDRATVLAKTMGGVRLLDIASLPGARGRT
ncbi:phosphoribosyl-dephospho-CoA transferase [Paraburkholderia sp. GAS41]|uniref:malonate decarboxylase holo-[acyl-carrier-protein] synthase n=1 Tax=Paraburkholderia sp. GAS41 TaxID=3035134 RepID=UPI003D232906